MNKLNYIILSQVRDLIAESTEVDTDLFSTPTIEPFLRLTFSGGITINIYGLSDGYVVTPRLESKAGLIVIPASPFNKIIPKMLCAIDYLISELSVPEALVKRL